MSQELRCHRCSMHLGESGAVVRIVGLFKPSLFGRLPKQSGEIRKRCGHCGWVNVFHPVRLSAAAAVKLKGRAA